MAFCQKHQIEYDCFIEIGGRRFSRPCPECSKEMDKEDEERQAEIEKASRIASFKFMNIEPMFYEANLENFIADTPELKKAVDTVRRLLVGEIQQIVMTGKNGTGKTHLAVAAVKEKNGKIFSMYEISTRIRASYTAIATETELQIVNELANHSLLAIDEIGRTKGSDSELNWLSYIIDKRHARGLPTIIISNRHVKKDCPKRGCEQCLENFISEDVMSRLAENGVLLRFTGDDWRKTKRQKEAQK